MRLKCPVCSGDIVDSARFCSNCGWAVGSAVIRRPIYAVTVLIVVAGLLTGSIVGYSVVATIGHVPIGLPFLFYDILIFGLGVAVFLMSLLGESLNLFTPRTKGYLVPFSVPFAIAYYLAMFATIYVRM